MNPAANSSSQPPSNTNHQSNPKSSEQPETKVIQPPSHTHEPQSAQERLQPIPPPSHPRQYRAIGLIFGKYQPSETQVTQGTIQTEDGITIEAVILGRIISLIKNHLDLTKNHLWVVYPRTRQNDDHLHVQIVGVWEPETLSKTPISEAETSKPEDGFFSVRGEVIFYSAEKETAVVKIRQSPRKEGDKVKFFKLKLKGTLPDQPIRHFWDIKAKRQKEALVIQDAEDLGLIQKKNFNKKGRKPVGKGGYKGRPTLNNKPKTKPAPIKPRPK